MFDLFEAETEGTGRGGAARLALLRAGLEEFGRNNLEGARTREIARRAGQNVASISYYFGGKRELYLEIARGIVGYMRRRMEPLIVEGREVLEGDFSGTREEKLRALDLLKRMHAGWIQALLAEERTLLMTMIILREQVLPTEAFEIIYEGFIQRMHTAVTRLVACLRGLDPESTEARLLAHSTLGQVVGFRAARESILRSARLEAITPEMAQRIGAVVSDNLDRLFYPEHQEK